jgi:FKBP-type peptidyl-prolyl cis-trans isomerase FkpA
MKNFKLLILFLCLAAALSACMKGDNDNFNEAAQFDADTAAIRAYLVTNKLPALKHESGVFYQIIAPGSGSFSYSQNTTVTANYAGRLLGSTTTFDKTTGTPATFPLSGVIPGWQIGIPLIQKGGSIRLFIPSRYAYKQFGQGPIPPNAILDFNVELVDVK